MSNVTDIIEISDLGDPRLEPFRDIRDRDLERRQGVFIGEQALTVEKMLSLPGVTLPC